MTTLTCGHGVKTCIEDGSCLVCRGVDWAVRWEATALCGLPHDAFDDLVSTDHATFQRAIVADPHPAGLDPRLVYASYLEESGDPRGELVRVAEPT